MESPLLAMEGLGPLCNIVKIICVHLSVSSWQTIFVTFLCNIGLSVLTPLTAVGMLCFIKTA